jgi:hypothetical protein
MTTRKVTNYFAMLSWWVIVTYFLSDFNNILVASDAESLWDWIIALALSWPLWVFIGEASEVIDKRFPQVGGFLEVGLKIVLNIIAILAVIFFGRVFWGPITAWFTAFPETLRNDNLLQTIVGIIWLITGISILIPDVGADSENLASQPIGTRLARSAGFLLSILWGILVCSLGMRMLIAGLSGG